MVSLESGPSFPSRILSRTARRFSPKLRDKIRDEKPGFEATGGDCMLARVLAKQSIYVWLYKRLLHVIIWNFKNVNYITCDSELVLPPLSLYSIVQSTYQALITEQALSFYSSTFFSLKYLNMTVSYTVDTIVMSYRILAVKFLHC